MWAWDMSVSTQRDKQRCAEVKRTIGFTPYNIVHLNPFWGPVSQPPKTQSFRLHTPATEWVRTRSTPPDVSMGHVSGHPEGQSTVFRSEVNDRVHPLQHSTLKSILGYCVTTPQNTPFVKLACDVCRIPLCKNDFYHVHDHRNSSHPVESLYVR